jgi:hypothetical protein
VHFSIEQIFTQEMVDRKRGSNLFSLSLSHLCMTLSIFKQIKNNRVSHLYLMELLKALVVALTNTDLMSRTANVVICFVFTFQFRLWFALVIGLNFTFFVVKALRILQQQNSRSVFLFLTIVAENRGEARFLILRFVHKVVNGNFLLTTMTSCLVNIEDDCFLKSVTLGHWLFESSVKSFLKTLLLRVRFHINVDGLDHDVDRFACRSC